MICVNNLRIHGPNGSLGAGFLALEQECDSIGEIRGKRCTSDAGVLVGPKNQGSAGGPAYGNNQSRASGRGFVDLSNGQPDECSPTLYGKSRRGFRGAGLLHRVFAGVAQEVRV